MQLVMPFQTLKYSYLEEEKTHNTCKNKGSRNQIHHRRKTR